MTDCPTVSVIVVSHGRPALLRRALIGIGQMFYRPFELVVVADAQGLAAVADLPFAGRMKTARQNAPNISAARNLGADLAGGQVLAFIDDDAVPEPTWLNHLVSPFSETNLAAATGTVLGRNGVSVQWANRIVDSLGQAHPASDGPLQAGHAVKLEGTNMAIRRDVLARLGGFDEGFCFFLDETDLAFRLMQAGLRAGFVPLATVHHGFAESARRRPDRVPLSLVDIGRSTALYLRKHAAGELVDRALNDLRQEQADRVARHRASGRIGQHEASRLLSGLEEGIEDGFCRDLLPARDIAPAPEFQPLLSAPPLEPAILAGRWFQAARLTQEAENLASEGRSVSLFLFDQTIRAHRVTFTESGVWHQSGGLFGPSLRTQPRFAIWSFNRRMAAERGRQEKIRWKHAYE